MNKKRSLSCAALVLALALFSTKARAAASEEEIGAASNNEFANPFSDYVPFEEEYDIDDDERFMYFGRFFGISLGTGAHVFGGNIGKLYNTSLPVFDGKLIYFFDFRLAGQLGVSSANHAYDAAPDGLVDVNLFRLNADLKYYFDTKNASATISAANPYAVAGVGKVFRTRTFQNLNSIQKDDAIAYSAGLGMEFTLKPRKTSFGVEVRYHEINFEDSSEGRYIDSGLADVQGPMYSFITSINFFF